MGLQTNMTNRAYRAQENVGADPEITAEAFRRYKFDLAYSPRSDMAKFVAEALAIDPKGDAGPDRGRRRSCGLEPADRRAQPRHGAGGADDPAADQGAAGRQARAAGRARPADAIAILKEHFGRLDPEWGEVNRIRRGKLDLPIDGGPDTYRAVYGGPGDDGRLDAADGDTLIMFVTWDKDGTPVVGQHPPVRLGHPGRALAPLRRPDPAVRGHEDQAGAVHRGPAEGPRPRGLPARP